MAPVDDAAGSDLAIRDVGQSELGGSGAVVSVSGLLRRASRRSATKRTISLFIVGSPEPIDDRSAASTVANTQFGAFPGSAQVIGQANER